MIDTFDGYDQRCKKCKLPYADHMNGLRDHVFEPMPHNLSVTWVSRWEITCECGFRVLRDIPNKDTAEIVAWLHLRRWDTTRAKEFAHNRGIANLVYAG